MSVQHGQGLDPDHGLLATIRRVEVRGRTVIEIHIRMMIP